MLRRLLVVLGTLLGISGALYFGGIALLSYFVDAFVDAVRPLSSIYGKVVRA